MLSIMQQSTMILFIGRIICGLVVGLNSTIVPVYIREVSPKVMTGKLGSSNQINFSVGKFIAILTGLGITNPD